MPAARARTALHAVAFLCLLLAAAVEAQSQRPSFTCARPRAGVTIVAGTLTQRCPCYFNVVFRSVARFQHLDISIYALPAAEYQRWLRAVDRDEYQRPAASSGGGVALDDVALRATESIRYPYVWSSGSVVVDTPGTFVAFALISQPRVAAPGACLWYHLLLDSRPDVCPLRLKKRKTPFGASTTVTGRHASSATPKRGGLATYVVGGTRVDADDEFTRYNALITTPGRGNCTGSVISARWILTAAHCAVRRGSIVRVGGVTLGDGDVYFASAVVAHPKFLGVTDFFRQQIANDIALVQLERRIPNPQVMQLNSRRDGPLPGTIVRATGYGKVTTAAASRGLRMVDTAVLSEGECKNRFQQGGNPSIARGIEDTVHLCTGRDNECTQGGVCFGDSGGPIVARMPDDSLVQVGVTSYGDEGCATRESADVFVRVSSYIVWIQQVTGNGARVVEWQSVDNVATGGSYGSPGSSAIAFPLWALVAIIVGACMTIVAVALIIFVRRSSSRPRRDDGDALPMDDPPSQQPPADSLNPPPAAASDSPPRRISPVASAPPSPPLPSESVAPLQPPPPPPPSFSPTSAQASMPMTLASVSYPDGGLGRRPPQ